MKLSEDKIIKIANKRNLPVKIKRIVRIKDMVEEKCILSNNEIYLCGTYVIITRDKENYIGSTEDFFERMCVHVCSSVKGGIPRSAYLFETEDVDDAMILERWLIQTFNPSLNINLRSKYDHLSDFQISRLKACLYKGQVRRKGLYDMVKNIQINDMLKDLR